MITVPLLQGALDCAGVEHFDAGEFLRGELPDSHLATAVRVLVLADLIRRHVGEPLILTSGYRSAAANKAVGGAPGSSHTYAAAVDLRVARAHLRPEANLLLRQTAALVWIAYPDLVAGLGLYAQNIHVDVTGAHHSRRSWTTTRRPPPATAQARAAWLADLVASTTQEQALALLEVPS